MIDLTVDPAIAALIVSCAALLFAAAAIHKLRDLRRFDEIFAAYGLMRPAARLGMSRLVPVLEAAVAGGLLFDLSRRRAAAVGIVLLLGYATAIAVNLARGRRDLACGCGGPDDRRPIAPWMAWRNVTVAVLLAIPTLPWGARPLTPTDAVTIGFGTATIALLYHCLNRLSATPPHDTQHPA
jgi:Methylamine utilisation protein MauE